MCGSPDIPLNLLKSVATYKGVDAMAPLVQWFWEVMEEFSNQERSLFLRFVWGRTRLPRTIADFRGRDFVLQVRERESKREGEQERESKRGRAREGGRESERERERGGREGERSKCVC